MAPIAAGGICMEAGAARRPAANGFKVGVLSSLGKAEALGEELGGIGVTGSNRSVGGLGRFARMRDGELGSDRRGLSRGL
ncbi:hypothetical protein [Limimaricola sp. AA108-03]|uniref:hypothetical protein n=1 Tax=Limimaricola sp. AA108-03 TaxID=3425945 RepID=UPI003D774DEF